MLRDNRLTFTRSAPWLGLLLSAAILVGCASKSDRAAEPGLGTPNSTFDASGSKPPTAQTLYSLARILAAQGRDAECEQVLRRIVEMAPDFMPAYNDMAEVAVRHNRLEDGIDALAAGLKRRPDEPLLRNNLGMCWLLMGDYDRAVEQFEKATQAAPQERAYTANLAMAMAMAGRYDKARETYEHVFPRDRVSVRDNMLTLVRARAGLSASTQPTTDQAPPEETTPAAPATQSSEPPAEDMAAKPDLTADGR